MIYWMVLLVVAFVIHCWWLGKRRENTAEHYDEELYQADIRMREKMKMLPPCRACRGTGALVIGGPKMRAVDCPECAGTGDEIEIDDYQGADHD